jgi:uncharacterized protein YycO
MKARIVVFVLLLAFSTISVARGGSVEQPPLSLSQGQTRTVRSWLDFKFDSNAAMGDAQNPAVILPSSMAPVIGDMPLKQSGDVIFIPASQLQQMAANPIMAIALAPILNQLSNIKSFDGFNAVDMTGLLKNLPSEIMEAPDAAAREFTPQDTVAIQKSLRDGDIVFGSHVINYMTWGRFNHVAIVVDAARGTLAEATATLPTDMPGVRLVDWKKFVSGYSHVGVVRLKGKSAKELTSIVSWVSERKGKPYRWPIIQGLNKTDQSRFYCSQLVWLAFREVLNLDLDVDKGVLVFPDDIYYSKEYVDVIVP